jgi:hypothetical protein
MEIAIEEGGIEEELRKEKLLLAIPIGQHFTHRAVAEGKEGSIKGL